MTTTLYTSIATTTATTLAGLGYALAFRASGRIEMAILAHFSLNAVHFLLLTYPGLAA
jgi:uncharacterized protein